MNKKESIGITAIMSFLVLIAYFIVLSTSHPAKPGSVEIVYIVAVISGLVSLTLILYIVNKPGGYNF